MLKKASGPENILVFLSFFRYHTKDVSCIRFREIREDSHMAEKLPIIIDNPILNSPFEEPQRHWRFSDEGITDEIVDGPLRIQNPFKHLDHAKREVAAARYYDIPANAVEQAARAKPEGEE